ncbi:acyl carrier protein phosphodiesterase [Gramella jeungdoensis]|uniref:Acyl carrier protein phosphodiesterase n=1 Tax=Gramella jeungdoensis TaxID=708091 RepID=A0ABT0Z459_9FLAO|nr:acyl carrier protein phosphodiesterase [Gramella jeungdoensis]MCM8570527.1 acyl carrier protein phosphodiesterase [Gramella jeungdoensis]
MNFLAHIYLSGDNEQLMVGNFMADSVKGKKYLKYPTDIKNGIILHRAIDYYTDTHEIFKQSTQRLFPIYGHYSGIIVDIFYDHFLAANWKDYSSTPLKEYTLKFYEVLEKNYEILPFRVKSFLPYMVNDNWLLSYSKIEGIEKVLKGMNNRTGRKSGMHHSVNELREYYSQFENEFKMFFKELIQFSQQKIAELKNE